MNVSIERDDAAKLDAMMRSDAYVSRSPFVRFLIRQEYARRHSNTVQQGAVQSQESAGNLQASCRENANG